MPLSVPETTSRKAKHALGYVNVAGQFENWFQFGFILCTTLSVLYVIMVFVKVDKDNE